MGETRRAARRPLVAWSLTVATLVVLAAALVLLGLNASRTDTGRIGFYILLSVGVLAYAGAGGLIARRVPGNAIGWLLGLAGLSLTVAMLSEQYALYGLATAPGTVPGAKVAGVLSAAAVAALAAGPVGADRRGGRPGRAAVPGGHHDQRRNHQRAERARGLLPEPAGGPSAARLVQRPPGRNLFPR